MLRLIVALTALAATNVGASDNERPTGKNCNLAAPPASAGESWNHGHIQRIYPRAKDIDPSYSGCQLMFDGPVKGKWIVTFVIEVAAGDAVRVWHEDMSADRAACRYKNGEVIAGDAKTCSGIVKLLKSVPPGCVKEIRKWDLDKGPKPACYLFE